MARPVVTDSTENLYERFDPLSAGDESVDWHLLKFLDALCSVMLEDVHALVTDRDDMPGWGVLLNVDEAPSYVLKYLAQYVGVRTQESMSDEDLREAIRSPVGFRRGSPAALVAAVQRFLTGGKHVVILERTAFGVDGAYRLFVRTYDAETPGGGDAAGTALVRSAIIREQKPAGILLDYDSIPGEIYNDWEAGPGVGTYNDVEPDFATYDEAETYIIP